MNTDPDAPELLAGQNKVPYATAADGTVLNWVTAKPEGRGPWPGAIIIHGGNFKGGGTGCINQVKRELVMIGYKLYSIEYRLCQPGQLPGQVTDGRYPDQTNDCELAVNAVIRDPEWNGQILDAVGGSAGGSHAQYLAVRRLVRRAVLLSPATQYDDPVSRENQSFANSVDNYASDLAKASPNTHIKSNMSMVFLIASELEGVGGNAGMPPNQFKLTHDKLSDMEVPFQSLLRAGKKEHSFDMWPDVAPAVCDFLQRT